ncbi:MAG: radical SAM protein [Candidatus Latescibacteria bacterium]|nr:radical SAM protein [Candidatus Latescibacterota bacterium]
MLRSRRQYRQILYRKLKEGGIPFLAGSAMRVAGTWTSDKVGRPLVGPSIGTLVITYRCNYFCEFCELPQRAVRRKREGVREFDPEEMLRLVRGFKAIRTAGVGITGGEPFIRKDLFDVLSEITRLGMVAHVNTNGHFLHAENVERLVRTGVDSVNISLDAPDAGTHNRIRGNRRSFELIHAGIEEIRRQRRQGKPRIGITTVLTADTVEKALDMARLAKDLGVDSLGFIPVHEYHDGSDASEMLKPRDFAARSEPVVAALQEEAGEILENSLSYLALFPRAFAGRPSGLKCYAPYNSVVVDCYGRVFPCVPFSEIDEPIATIDADGLPAIWRSRAYAEKRASLSACQACYWNCHTEMNLLLQGLPPEEE